MPIPEETEKLLRDFLLRQRQDEQRRYNDENRRSNDYGEIKRMMAEAREVHAKALGHHAQVIVGRVDRLERDVMEKIADVREVADAAHALALGANARLELFGAAKPPGGRQGPKDAPEPPRGPLPWDMGELSQTGTNIIVPVEAYKNASQEWNAFFEGQLAQRERLHDGDTWRWLKEHATKIGVAVIGSVVAAVVIAQVITTTIKPVPTTQQHP